MSTSQIAPAPALRSLKAALQAVSDQEQLCLRGAERMAARELHVIARALTFIARQEAEQAAFLRLLCPDAPASASLPDLPHDPADLLLLLIAREEAAVTTLLPQAARDAAQAGHPRAAAALSSIARTDDGHLTRLRTLRTALQDGTLLHSESAASWFCLGCGSLHNGCDAPEVCESCSRGRGHFIRSDLYALARC